MSSPSSPPPPLDPLPDGILTLALPAPNAPRPHPSSSTSHPTPPRRTIPPPCWSHDETLALISSYKAKWLSLRRGPLRAPDWLDVASSLSLLPSPFPPKTPLQCRHKIEKLRKRFRAERLRAARAHPSAPPRSTWLYFGPMSEISPDSAAPPPPQPPSSSSDGSPEPPPVAEKPRAPVESLVAAVQRLAEGYVRMERMNIDLMREVEKMRMEMELKQTEMMLDTQRRIVEVFAKGIGGGGRKRIKISTAAE